MLVAQTGGERGPGKTFRALQALPDGAVYVVHNRAMRDHCARSLEAMGRSRTAVTVVAAEDASRYLWGRRPPAVDVDHAVYEGYVPGRVRDEVAKVVAFTRSRIG